jgi:hypothetical protein
MKPFELFKAGRHTAASGSTIAFSDDELRAAVAAYDPALHEAPIVVGHPRENAPAYGWIKALAFDDGTITADPAQVDEAFAEMVQAGRFKKRSASFYLPTAPNNPTPGSYYLRHVGFLGAVPPAVKGLKDVQFNDAEEGVVEFTDSDRWAWGSLAALLRGLREWVIGEKGLEVADKILPSYAVADIESAARAPSTDPALPASYSEDETMNLQELTQQVATLTAEKAAITAERDTLKTQVGKVADFAEQDAALKVRETALAAAEKAISRTRVDARVEGAIKAGRLLPKDRTHTINFAMALDDGESGQMTIDYGEGAAAKKVTLRESYLLTLEAAPKIVDYTERAAAGDGPAEGAADPQAIADKAREIRAKAEADGKTLSFTEAVAKATAEIAG